MRTAAEEFLDALDPQSLSLAVAPFDTTDHREWTYLPGSRPGVAVDQLTDAQCERAFALLDTGMSAAGAATARDVMALDDVLRDLERQAGGGGWRRRGSGQYWFRVLGAPDPAAPWAWRVNGHHLAVHLTVVGDAIAGTPQFFGANPAVVRSGPRSGWQILRPEVECARSLLVTLGASQRSAALVAPLAPADILTRRDPVADPHRVPSGVRHDQLGGAQRITLERLVRVYLDRTAPAVASAAWNEIVEAGLGEVAFAWAGDEQAGRGHYYAIRGPTFLAEYDNVQDNANHVHTVWRDLRNDWGRDVLAEHYRGMAH